MNSLSHDVPPKKESLTPHQTAFLAAFAECGSVLLAASAAGVSRRSHSRWLQGCEEYRQAFDDAREDAADALAAEARRRAVEGVEKPVFYKGEQVGSVRQYSDTLLIFLLKAAKPEKYGDRQPAHEPNLSGQIIICLPDNNRDGYEAAPEPSGSAAA